MKTTIISGLGLSNPALYVPRDEAYECYMRDFDVPSAQRELYGRLLLEGPIRGRHVAMETTREAAEDDPDALASRFERYGPQMAVAAARGALEEAGLEAADVGGLVVNTCTGYLCPGLSSYVAEELELPPNVRFFDLMGMGCGGAVPNLENATGIIARGAAQHVLSISVEVCSATLFMGDDPGLTVSNCIFGDGAAATVMSSAGASRNKLLEILDFETGLFPAYRDHLRYRTETGRLRNVLSRRVPAIGAQTVAEVARRLLARHRLDSRDIAWWSIHPGGTSVLDRVQKAFKLPDAAVACSHAVFGEYGNMSSPSVLFVLRRILDSGEPACGDLGLILAFGAGFSAFAALVKF